MNTLLNIKKIRSSLAPETDICHTEILFCATNHGLPLDTEKTSSLPYSDVIRLFEVSEKFQEPFRRLLEDFSARDGCAPMHHF